MNEKPQRAPVAVLKTSPESVLEDYARLLRLARYQSYLPKDKDTALKINISWAKFYPGCSTTPWQIDGVVRALLEDGYNRDLVHACHNDTVVVNARRGEQRNKQKTVTDSHRLRNVHLYQRDVEWIPYEPQTPLRVLHDIYPDGVRIPRRMIGENIIHLPTMKTHVFTSMTGAMKNAFGGLLNRKRHWTHSVIHETLVDLLQIQKEIHAGIFAVMDGTVAGSGPGPRCMEVHTPGLILASADQVAIDAVAARIMGFDPMTLDFIRIAHEAGLGCGDPKEIEIVGDDVEGLDLGFHRSDTFASRGQHAIYHGIFRPLERLLLRTPLVVGAYMASWAYHDWYWYPFKGRRRVRAFLETPWGRLFQKY
jgi:uncharacterized protein (DUF362 family)